MKHEHLFTDSTVTHGSVVLSIDGDNELKLLYPGCINARHRFHHPFCT